MNIKTPFVIGLLTLVTVMFCSPLLYASNLTLSWDRPVVDINGSPLTDLAGFYVYTGFSSRNYLIQEDLGNVTHYIFENVLEGQVLYLAVTAYDTSGNESDYSEEFILSVPYCDENSDGINCDADFDNNGIVGLEDFNELRTWFGQSVPPAPAYIDCDGDGAIGLGDFNCLRTYFGSSTDAGTGD